MATSIMQRLELIAMRDDANELIRRLTWLSCVEIESDAPPGIEAELGEKLSCDEEKSAVLSELSMLENALYAVKKYGKSKRGLLSAKIPIEKRRLDAERNEAAMGVARELSELAHRVGEIDAETVACDVELASLAVWQGYDMPLCEVGTQEASVTLGYFPAGFDVSTVADKLGDTPALYDIELVSSDKRGVFVCAVAHKSIQKRFDRALGECEFTRLDFRDMTGTAASEIADRKKKKEALKAERERALTRLRELASRRDDIEICYDAKRLELSKIEAKQKLSCTERTVYMTAWTPRKAVKAVSHALAGLECWYEFSDPAPEDDVPVTLDNKSFAKPFEGVVEMYSMPKYLSFDPTLIMSVFYFIIFGLMLADVGYGIELMLGGLFLLKKMRPQGSTRNLVSMITICGISSTVCGALFGSYFGDLPAKIIGRDVNIALMFDIVKEPMNFLYISLGVGALHLLAGMAIKFYMLWKRGDPLAAIFDVGSWYVLFAGVGMIFVLPSVGKYVAIAGVLMLILTQGRAEKNIIMKFLKGLISLYDLVSYVSDLLSYSRIMAMGLASAVIASVFNILGAMGGPVGIILMVLVGHTLNLAISVLGTYVHNCRLQFIEFFGKFYEDGGRAFRPVRPDLKYTELVGDKTK